MFAVRSRRMSQVESQRSKVAMVDLQVEDLTEYLGFARVAGWRF